MEIINSLNIDGNLTSYNLNANSILTDSISVSYLTQTINVVTNTTMNSRNGLINIESISLIQYEETEFTVINNYCISNSIIFIDIIDYGQIGFPICNVKNINNGSFEISMKNINSYSLSGSISVSFIIF